MSYTYDGLREQVIEALAATGLVEASAVTLAAPKPNIPTDLAFAVFASAKAAGENPNEFARKLAEAVVLPSGGMIGRVEAAGGFVNFAVEPGRFAEAVIAEVQGLGAHYGDDTSVGQGEKVILEYSSPNIARKMHVGHLRTTVIGHALYNIFQSLGYEVIGDNHLGDWGTQFGTLLAAIHNGNLTPWDDADPVQSLVEIYADFNNAAKENSALMDDARAWFKKLEDGDPWAKQTWQRLIDITMEEFERTYTRLGVHFDTQHGESYFEPMLAGIVQEAIDKGVAHVNPEGAVVVEFGEDSKLPSCLLRKTDGATLYQTRDAATCLYRWQNYQPVRNVYVVGAEQKLHFQQVFEIVRRIGYEEIADRSTHISFGRISLALSAEERAKLTDEESKEREKISMRSGNVIFLNDLLDEGISRAKTTVAEKIAEGKTELTEDEIDSVGEILGIGAVIYADLHQGPDRNIVFDWDKILSFDGNTALYIQYTHARCRSILREAGQDARASLASADTSVLTAPEEQAVLKVLYRLPHAIREAGEKYLPAIVAEWTYTLAREFARFYHECPVLKAPTPELRAARLALVSATAQGIKNGLGLLAIGAPERM